MLLEGIAAAVFTNFSCERRTVQNPTPSIAISEQHCDTADLSLKAVLACFSFAGRAAFPVDLCKN